jgi:hypothetical protein
MHITPTSPQGPRPPARRRGPHALLAAAVLLGGALPWAQADTLPAIRIAQLMAMAQVDTNKDGRVSRAEFLAMAAQAYDMALGAKNAGGGKAAELTEAELQALRRAMAAP